MKNIRLSCFVAFVFFALVAGSRGAGGGWAVVPSPNLGTQANNLSAVAASADDDVWAVGAGYDEDLFAWRTVIEHWNGADWSLISSPNATSGNNFLNGVAVAGPNDIWAVGQAANGGNTYSTLIEHSAGGTPSLWSIVPSPNVAGSSCILNAISVVALNDIWAVGYSIDSNFNNQSLTMHWDGANWQIVPSPSVGDDILYAVDAIASNDIWATGRTRVGYSSSRTLTLHWDGSNWMVVASPNDSTGNNSLYGVAAISANDVWAVGAAGSSKTLALHWNGLSWSVMLTPALSNALNEVLVGIVAASSGDIWTTGQFNQDSVQKTLTEHWNGSAWTSVPSPNPESSSNRLQGIAVTSKGTLWAVGTTGVFGQPERTLILRYRAKSARR
ncbi:MAG TPA: hypothetical protein VJU77_12630 [Chthoniobacterales bacterium]|nr:hypothetical protein [Chthoniobacterales bacterium]